MSIKILKNKKISQIAMSNFLWDEWMETSTPVCQESSFFENIVLGVYKIALNKEYPLYQKKIIDQTGKN